MTYQRVPGYRSRRFIIREYPGEGQVSDFANTLGWERLGEVSAEKRLRQPRQVIWQLFPGVVLQYMEEEEFHASYVVMMSEESRELSHHMAQIIEGGIAVLTDEELLEGVTSASGRDEKARALIIAGIGAPPHPDNRYSRLLIEAARSPSKHVRECGVLAIGYTEWPPFRELLKAIAQQDSDRKVRRLASAMVEAFDTTGVGGSK